MKLGTSLRSNLKVSVPNRGILPAADRACYAMIEKVWRIRDTNCDRHGRATAIGKGNCNSSKGIWCKNYNLGPIWQASHSLSLGRAVRTPTFFEICTRTPRMRAPTAVLLYRPIRCPRTPQLWPPP